MRNLVLALAAFALVWIGLSFHDSGSRDSVDQFILAEISLGLFLAAFVMLLGRPEWPVRAVGLFLVVLGTAWFYGPVIWLRWNEEASVDVARAALMVGAPLFLFSLIAWVKAKWFGPAPMPTTGQIEQAWHVSHEPMIPFGDRPHISTPGYDGPERRVGPADRRQANDPGPGQERR